MVFLHPDHGFQNVQPVSNPLESQVPLVQSSETERRASTEVPEGASLFPQDARIVSLNESRPGAGSILGLRAGDVAVGSSTGPFLRRGANGPEVVQLQERLNAVGFQVGTPDGDFGGNTEQGAVDLQAFARAYLPQWRDTVSVDGMMGNQGWAILAAIEEAGGVAAIAAADQTGRMSPLDFKPLVDPGTGEVREGAFYADNQNPQGRRVAVFFGGYSATARDVFGWAAEASNTAGDLRHIYAMQGPATSNYFPALLPNTGIARHIAELMQGDNPPEHIELYAHSSGAFVMEELLQYLEPGSAQVTVHYLDGGSKGLNAAQKSKVDNFVFVTASGDGARAPNYNSMRNLQQTHGGRFVVLPAPGVTGSWSLHDRVITTRPHESNLRSFGQMAETGALGRDYGRMDFNNPVSLEYRRP